MNRVQWKDYTKANVKYWNTKIYLCNTQHVATLHREMIIIV